MAVINNWQAADYVLSGSSNDPSNISLYAFLAQYAENVQLYWAASVISGSFAADNPTLTVIVDGETFGPYDSGTWPASVTLAGGETLTFNGTFSVPYFTINRGGIYDISIVVSGEDNSGNTNSYTSNPVQLIRPINTTEANDDDFTDQVMFAGTTYNIDLLDNDVDPQGHNQEITHINGSAISVGSPVTIGTVTFDLQGDGTIDVDSTAPVSASYTYTITDDSDDPKTDTATFSIVILNEPETNAASQHISFALDSADDNIVQILGISNNVIAGDPAGNPNFYAFTSPITVIDNTAVDGHGYIDEETNIEAELEAQLLAIGMTIEDVYFDAVDPDLSDPDNQALNLGFGFVATGATYFAIRLYYSVEVNSSTTYYYSDRVSNTKYTLMDDRSDLDMSFFGGKTIIDGIGAYLSEAPNLQIFPSANDIDFSMANLTTAMMDSLIDDLAVNGLGSGSLTLSDQTTGDSPTPAKVTQIQTQGWTVAT